MKLASFQPAAACAAFFSLAGLAQAHPGHFAMDWVSAPPHPGHGVEYATLLMALGLTAALLGACWMASRKR